ncbi:T-cell surface glycoprotein CD8 alpha chain [Sorex fumeus]|uniref:T-cell surface glycoprotein CD8 alpha chain n=1 Tax=Sorex fumeus TaxID=62283 RepID=UPI0024AD1781|nr:T-cell surface glycoprotein CD8 alpha chain [Sorex fumeus]
MAWPVPALLLLLALLLHAGPAYQESNVFRMPKRLVKARPGDTENLKCQVLSTQTSGGGTWLFQPRNSKVSPTFLAYLPKSGNNVLSDKFSSIAAKRDENMKDIYILTLKNIQEEHEGYYFCMVVINAITHFSPFIEVQLPGKITTPAPRPSTPASTVKQQSLSTTADTCVPTETRARRKGVLDLSCDTYIWAPLSGICVVLLLSLVSVLVCCRRNQRRVCKCPRPHVRLGGKPSPSERSV